MLSAVITLLAVIKFTTDNVIIYFHDINKNCITLLLALHQKTAVKAATLS